jgi:hypothetical protein
VFVLPVTPVVALTPPLVGAVKFVLHTFAVQIGAGLLQAWLARQVVEAAPDKV